MRRYWIKFDVKFGQKTYGVLLGCGITADSLADAMKMAAHIVFRGDPLPTVLAVTEDVTIADLDAKHVVPNIADSSRPGVWYPAFRGGQDTSVLQTAVSTNDSSETDGGATDGKENIA